MWRSVVLFIAAISLLVACGAGREAPDGAVRVAIPAGSGLGAVSDTLASRDIIQWPYAFRMYTRLRGADRSIKPGVYELTPGSSWSTVLDKLVRGDVVTLRFTIPEGWTVRQIGPRLAAALDLPVDSVMQVLADTAAAERFEVPGPTLEGYLYPATYEVPVGTSLERVLRTVTSRYQRVWTPELRARADSVGLSEREVVALASIVEAEARVWTERDTIAAVYRNRLDRGMRLQADPTVQYALGERQSRLLYSHIDDVADHPYNTYRHDGIPPGPIGSPSAAAIRATLYPADVEYLFFVARPDGTHLFTRSFAEHTAARRQLRREVEERRRAESAR
jgi:UPF0755 protein